MAESWWMNGQVMAKIARGSWAIKQKGFPICDAGNLTWHTDEKLGKSFAIARYYLAGFTKVDKSIMFRPPITI
jgi:hypothetical protein